MNKYIDPWFRRELDWREREENHEHLDTNQNHTNNITKYVEREIKREKKKKKNPKKYHHLRDQQIKAK